MDKISKDFSEAIGISIVLYQTPLEELCACLNSLFAYRNGKKIVVTCVDNSPTATLHEDKILAYHKNGFEISYVHNPANPGYGASHNIGIQKSVQLNCKYHLVINSDVFFHGDVLGQLVQFLEKEENKVVGQVMPKVLYPNGELQYLCKLSPSPFDLIFRRFLPKKLLLQQKNNFELRFTKYDRTMFVPYLSGCFMFFRMEALKEVGGFDERFFMYAEDIDITRRVAMNYETIYFPESTVYHVLGGASRKSLRMLFHHAWNVARYFRKWGWFFDGQRRVLNQRTLNQFSDTIKKSQ